MSAQDLCRFASAALTGSLLPENIRELQTQVVSGHHALGWQALPARSGQKKLIFHAGSSIGSRTMLAYEPDTGTTIIILLKQAESSSAIPQWNALNALRRALAAEK